MLTTVLKITEITQRILISFVCILFSGWWSSNNSSKKDNHETRVRGEDKHLQELYMSYQSCRYMEYLLLFFFSLYGISHDARRIMGT